MTQIKKATNVHGLLNAFKNEPLRGDDLDKFFYQNTMESRTGDPFSSPVKVLFEACTTPSSRNAHLFMGHRGCGKTVELNNLKRKFEEVGHWVHIVETMNDLQPKNYWDVLLLITEGLCDIASRADVSLPIEPFNEIHRLLHSEIQVVESNANSASVGASAGVEVKSPPILRSVLNLFMSLKSDLKLETQTRTNVITTMQKRASDWLRHTHEIANHLTAACNHKQPIIIFEDLDKLSVPQDIFKLLEYTVLSQLPFPIIYTFPISQYYSTNFAAIGANYKHNVLPMIKISNKNETPNDDGIAVIKEIVALRADLSLFDKDVLELLIDKTGGSLRHLFECITVAARRANWRESTVIEMEDATRAIGELSKDLTRKITIKDYPHLAQIKKSKEQIEDLDFILGMMHASIVLEYENGERWNDIHPLVADFVNKHYKPNETAIG